MVDVRLRDHGSHRACYVAFAELVPAVLVPDGFEVEVRTVEKRFEEGETAGVRDAGVGAVVVGFGGENPFGVWFCFDVVEDLDR